MSESCEASYEQEVNALTLAVVLHLVKTAMAMLFGGYRPRVS